MRSDPDARADTRMMGIVHQALRRDLGRARTALASTPPPPPVQYRAITDHLLWMMEFLRAHHRSEDDGLFPRVRERDPDAAELLDAMVTDHETIAAAVAEVESAATSPEPGGSAELQRLLAALEHLSDVLLPHLQQEESAVMPAVSGAITNREWRALEKEHNLDPKSFVELGREGHWLLDEAGPEDRRTVLELVPPVPRFVLLHGFARSYRRRTSACWQPPSPPRRVQKTGRCIVDVDADIDAVWEVVRDVTRVGEWSHECVQVEWLDGCTAPQPGARFRGRNHAGFVRWGRVSEIVAADPYELVWRTVPTALYPDSSEWRITLRPGDDGGTTIEQAFRVIRAPKVLDAVYATMVPGHRDRTAALTADLRRLGECAATQRQSPGGRVAPVVVGETR